MNVVQTLAEKEVPSLDALKRKVATAVLALGCIATVVWAIFLGWTMTEAVAAGLAFFG